MYSRPGTGGTTCLTLSQSTEGELKKFQTKSLENEVRKRDQNRVNYFKKPDYQRLKVTNVLLIDLKIKTTR